MKSNPTPWWYLAKAIRSKSFFDLTTVLSIVGLTLGVASLVVSMAVFSGYVHTLKNSVQNLFGHVVIFNRGLESSTSFDEKIRSSQVPIKAHTSFLAVESVLAHKGVMSGVMIEGVDTNTLESVVSIKEHLIEGSFSLSPDEPLALIGKGVATKFGLKVGDQFRVVTPQSAGLDALQLKPKVLKMTVTGILNFGRYDFDSRYILTNLKVAQDYNGRGDQVSGMRLRLEDPEVAESMARILSNELGDRFWVRDWSEINKNLFEAVGLEKAVIFFLLMILILVACFNLSSQLIVGVVRRYQDIAILKTCGAGPKSIQKIFTWHGLVTGSVGCLFGFILGVILCYALEAAQMVFPIVPAEVYKLDHIELDIQMLDLFYIFSSTLLISFFSTLIPARMGSQMSPVKGLRYD